MKKNKLKIVCICLSLILFTFVGCGQKKKNEVKDSGNKEFTVLLDWYPNAIHSFLYVAMEKGYFKDAGLDVKFATPAGTDDGIKLVAAKKFNLAISYPQQLLMAKDENIPLTSVGSIVKSPLNQLMIRKDCGIKTLKDLEGKKVGYSSMETYKETVIEMAKYAGADPSKIEFVDVGYELIPSIQTKRVDAIMGGFINHEKLLLEKEGVELITLNPKDFGVPNNYELVFIANEETLKEDSSDITAFLKAVKKAYEYTLDNKKEALDILFKVQDEKFPLDKDIEEKSLDVLLPLMGTKENFLLQEESHWKELNGWLKKKNIVKNDLDIKTIYSNLNIK